MTAQPEPQRYTQEEYLMLERLAEGKSEFLDGQILPLSAPNEAHLAVVAHLITTVGGQLRDTLCHTLASHIKVRTAPTGLFAYPDLAVFCGEPRFQDHHQDVLVNPVALFEVYSPETEAFDRGRKFACYQQIETLTDYVLVAQGEPRLEHYARLSENVWSLTIVTGPDAELHLDSIDCTLLLSELYHHVAPVIPDP